MKTTCTECSKTWGGIRAEHCCAEGQALVPLWPATIALSDFDPPALEVSPDGGRVSTENLSDSLSAITEAVEPLGFLPIDPSELSLRRGATPVLRMVSGMFLGGQDAKVARIIVGSVSVDVVNFLFAFRASDEAVLVCLDVLVPEIPPEPDVPVSGFVSGRREVRWYLAFTEGAYRFGIRGEPLLPAGIAPPTLAGGVGDNGLAIDADNIHTLIVQWSCHETFSGTSSGDKHRRGEYPNRTCSTDGLVHNAKRDLWQLPGTWAERDHS